MLINASRAEEVRAAILDEGRLHQLEIEVGDANLLKGNIYKGRVANVEGSLNACFVEFGEDKQGFLPIDEIAPGAYHRKWEGKDRPKITDVMQKGRELVVQVVKDPIGNKGAALTTRVSLAGRYIVLMPLDDVRGVSRKASSDSQRKQIKEIASTLKIDEEYGFIVRTAGLDRTKTDLNRDAALLMRTWKNVEKAAAGSKAPAMLHEDRDLVVRMLRDYYDSDISRILIDEDVAHAKAEQYFRVVMPRTKGVLEHYTAKVPMFARYKVEEQIEEIHSRRADLKSGGYILIDPTEALISIDVNSGRSTRQKSQEETALHTNLEAAREVARQLRLRDLGGLIVIDFIDMPTRKANRQVEKVLKDSLKGDKARTYVGKISDNGLLEVNRQRLKQSLRLQTHRDCPTCLGRGVIENPSTVARSLLRGIEAKAAGGSYGKVIVGLHPELADHVQNLHRRELVELEQRFALIVVIEGRAGLHRSERETKWSSLDSLPDAERRMVEQRRNEMIAANRARHGVRLQVETTVDDVMADLAALEAELGPVSDEEEPSVREAARRARQENGDDDDDERESRGRGRGRGRGRERVAEDDELGTPERRARRGRGRSRARGRGAAGDHVDAHGAVPGLGPEDTERTHDADDEDGDGRSRSAKRRARRKRTRDDDEGGEGDRDRNDRSRDGNRERPERAARSGNTIPTEGGEAGEGRKRRRRRRGGRSRRGRGEGDSAGEGVPAAADGGGERAPREPRPPRAPRAPRASADGSAAMTPVPPASPAAPPAEKPTPPPAIQAAPSGPPPGESLAPPPSGGLFRGLKRYFGGGSGDGSSEA